MTAYLDSRPAGVDVSFRPGNTIPVELTWPAGQLTGRTFTSTLGGVALALEVVGDVIVIEATEAQTLAVTEPVVWLLTETTGGGTLDVLVGRWSPSDRAGDAGTVTQTVVVGDITVAVTVNSAQASIVTLSSRVGRLVTWPDAATWTDLFADATNVSNPTDSTPVLTASGGYGLATHGPPESAGANDRRIYYLDGTDCSDCEVRLDWEIVAGNTQVGIALRGDNDQAVIVWSNIIFSVNVKLLSGIWEFTGTALSQTNQLGELDGYPLAVMTASGDGSTVTVRTRVPHNATAGAIVHLSGVGSFGDVTIATVPTATTFTFASATAGSWSGGTFNHLFTPGRRKVAVRLVGNTLTAKQWLPAEDEPAWDEAGRFSSFALPATLLGSGGPPPSSGRVGIVVAHLGDTGQVKVGDFEFHNLDPLDGRPTSPAGTDDAHEQIGVQTARVDDLVTFPTNPTARRQNLAGWAYDPVAASASTVMTNGVLYLVKVPVDREATISNVLWGVSVAGNTPTAGQCWAGLYSPAGARLGQVGVDGDISSTGLKTSAITPVVVPPGFLWAAFLFNAGLAPAMARGANNVSTAFVNAGLSAAATYRFASRAGPQTTLPASFTPSTNSLLQITPWAALS